jgi:hypothetical protein
LIAQVVGAAHNGPMGVWRGFVAVGLCAAQCGCGALLPSGSSETPSQFASFDQAKHALEQVVPQKTTLENLAALGFNPQASANVTLIPYPEVISRLVPYSAIRPEDIDPGVRDCIAAQSACRAYLFRFGSEERRREGGFWLDFLNFKRVNHITGWRFEGLVVVDQKVVLFRNYAGEAKNDRIETQTNPLGPFQPSGEAAARAAVN